MNPPDPLKNAFKSHARRWRAFKFCYPVISRRSKGLSIGVNLNPDKACNFDCIYCCVDRTTPSEIRDVDIPQLESELRQLVQAAKSGLLFSEPEFSDIPIQFRRINDIAFSGDGEPTTSPHFRAAAEIAVAVRSVFGLDTAKIITITDACFLKRPAVADTLAFLDQHNGEIWAKLDAGTDDYLQRVDRPNIKLAVLLDNILFAARIRPIVIQALFVRMHDEPPSDREISEFTQRLCELRQGGGEIKLVQVYTVARRAAETYATRLTAGELERIAETVRKAGLAVEWFA